MFQICCLRNIYTKSPVLNKKESEIGVAQNLISELAGLPSGQTFSLDALHTQTATVQAIAAAGHHCLIAVKQHQPTAWVFSMSGKPARKDSALYRTIELTAQTPTALSHAISLDSSHGRMVERSVSVFAAPVAILTKT